MRVVQRVLPLTLVVAALSLNAVAPARRMALPAASRVAATRRCGWTVASEAGEMRSEGEEEEAGQDGQGEVYEVVLARPIGMQLAERSGSGGVAVSMVYEGGNELSKRDIIKFSSGAAPPVRKP